MQDLRSPDETPTEDRVCAPWGQGNGPPPGSGKSLYLKWFYLACLPHQSECGVGRQRCPTTPIFCSTRLPCNYASSERVAAEPSAATSAPDVLGSHRCPRQPKPPRYAPRLDRPQRKPSLYWTHSFPGFDAPRSGCPGSARAPGENTLNSRAVCATACAAVCWRLRQC